MTKETRLEMQKVIRTALRGEGVTWVRSYSERTTSKKTHDGHLRYKLYCLVAKRPGPAVRGAVAVELILRDYHNPQIRVKWHNGNLTIILPADTL